MSKTSSKVKNDWNKKNYDRITIIVKKGDKEKIQKATFEKGYNSVNELIKDRIRDII